MKMSTRQHYLSQCIITNFIIRDDHTFYEYDCGKEELRIKNARKLFSDFRLWSSEFESILDSHFENELGPILKTFATCTVKRGVRFGPQSMREAQFNGFQINDEEMCKTLSKLFFQQILIHFKSKSDNADQMENVMKTAFSGDGLSLQYPILVEINPLVKWPPLILIDGMFFLFAAPDNDKSKLCHISFMFPISESRMLIWGDINDYKFFARKFKNITYLNLCRIEQQGKVCKIASQNQEYLKLLIGKINYFNSGEKIRISSARDSNR